MLAEDVGWNHRGEVAAILPCVEPVLYIHKTLSVCITLQKWRQYHKGRKNAPARSKMLWALCDQPACLRYSSELGLCKLLPEYSLMAIRCPVKCGPDLYLIRAVRRAQMEHGLVDRIAGLIRKYAR